MKRKIACFMLIIFMSFNIYELDLNTRKVNINQPVHAIEPVTAYFISSAIAGLALSLGYQLVNSTSDSFTQGCMTLYNNFTTNTKNLIDRIAGRKQAGDSTYDVTPSELESFGNELTSAIEGSVSENNGIISFNLPAYNFPGSNPFNRVYFPDTDFHNVFVNLGLNYGETYDLKIYYNENLISHCTYTERLDSSGNLTSDVYDVMKNRAYYGNSVPYPTPNINVFYSRYDGVYYYDLTTLVGSYINSTNSKTIYTIPELVRIEMGKEIPQEPPVINVGQMNISELIAALQASGALNSQGAVTQQFITNYDTAVPSDIYTDLEAKTVVDGLFDGADTNVPDVPQDWGIVQSMYQVLQNIYSTVKTGFSNVYSKVASIVTSISDIFAYDPALTVDLSGFNNLVIKEKFPFSIPFDLYNAIKLFSASAAEPQFVVSIHNKFLDIEHEIDISFLSTFILFFRWVASVWFTIFLITKTRDMIKW